MATVRRPDGDDQHHDREGGQVEVHGPGDARAGLQPGSAEHREEGDQDAPAGEDQPEPGLLVWHTPSGRIYVTTPIQHLI